MPHHLLRRLAATAAVLAAPALALTAAPTTPARAAAANPTSGYWTGTWASAPQAGGDSFSGQTIRQVVHTSIGGNSARLQVSNAFGSAPLTVSDVHIAQAGSGSAVVGGTDHTVTFGGSATVTIPAGGTGISDSIAYAVPAATNLAISFYLPGNTGASTFHQFSMSTSYVAGGDVSGAASLSGAQTQNNYYFLSSLDVQNPNSAGAVVTLGASITDGYASSIDANNRWPDVLASRLKAAGDTIGVLNEGISGNKLLADGAGQSAVNRFARDVLAQPGVRWVVFSDDPINDLGSTSPQPTAAQLISGLQQLIAATHQNGITFICSTLTPYQGAGYWNASGETAREAIDSYVRSSGSGCDGVIDQDAATHDPSNPTWYLLADDSGDHLHPSNAGYQAIGNAVNLGLFTQPNLPVISLRAHANGDYVTADNGGGSPLIANRTAIGFWEQFDEIDQGNGAIALRSHANGLIVTADNAGAQPLIANRTAVGAWETFQLIHNPDGSVSLKADANGDYVTAENAGAQPLIANRTAIGAWEEFDLIRDN
ncbi:SGNH/GDSL hydrolase family protein [Catenulispora rubra]|uniref:SGNH/GDSL hydrolase family protein n=1 Tax=Catenulispora rubra TaxID=280293 RepID=UPI0018922844|nr:SGNH/GDSL hydrolase family protein [Catenulispora rubra]